MNIVHNSGRNQIWMQKSVEGGVRKMPLGVEMQRMAERILQSQDLRTNRLAGIFGDTEAMMQGLRNQRLEHRETQQEELKKATHSRVEDTRKMLCQFRATREASSRQKGKELEQFLRSLGSDTKSLKADAKAMTTNFRKEHEVTAREVHRSLSTFAEQSEAETSRLLGGYRADRERMKRGIQRSLSGFVDQNKRQIAQFRRGCNTERKQVANAQSAFLRDFVGENTREVAQLRKCIHELMRGLHDEHAKGSQAWRQMNSVMAERRKKGPSSVPEAHRPRRSTIEEQLLKLIKENPDGRTLADLAYTVHMPSVSVARVLKQMIARSEIRKLDRVYLSTTESS